MPAVPLAPRSTAPPPVGRELRANTRALGGFARCGSILVFAVLVLVIWMDQSVFPVGVAVQGPDGSFQSAFEHFFEQRSRAGVDWVYTYGPLGFIENFTYDSDLFIGRLIFADLFWRLTCAALLACAFLRNATGFERAVGFVALVLTPLNPDAYIYLFTLAGAEVCIDKPKHSGLLVTTSVALVTASLAKFTSFGLLIPCMIAIGSTIWQVRSRRAALTFVGASFGLWIALWWVVCRQSLFDIPAFLWRSLEMTRAYAGGMASEALPAVQERGLWVLGLTAACFFLPLFEPSRANTRFAPGLVRAFVLFAVFKAGFVRGADHGMIFFTFAMIAPFAIVDDLPAGTWWRIAQVFLRFVNLYVAYFGVLSTQGLSGPVASTLALRAGEQIDWSVRLATELDTTRAELDRQIGLARTERALPRTREVVGRDTIDIHPPFQDTVLFNDMNWQPRPVFQSYATLSDSLQQINARFFESERAPQWFLLLPRAIDGRLETMEDAPSMLIIARDYKPLFVEQDMLLLRRDPQPASAEPNEVLIDRELAFGEALDLSSLGDDVHLLQLEATPTWRGRLRAFALRPVPIHAMLTARSGRQVGVQLIPNMLKSGAIVDPLLADTRDWVRFYAGRADRTSSLTLLPSSRAWAYPSKLRVRILRSPIRPRLVDVDPDWLTRFSMFETTPDDYSGVDGGRTIEEAGLPVFAVSTPSVFRYRVLPGRHVVSGMHGLLAEAYEKGASDGVTFQVHFMRGVGQFRKVFERTIDPRTNPSERGPLAFEFEFDAEVGGEIALSTRPGPRQDFRDDRAFWTKIRVE